MTTLKDNFGAPLWHTRNGAVQRLQTVGVPATDGAADWLMFCPHVPAVSEYNCGAGPPMTRKTEDCLTIPPEYEDRTSCCVERRTKFLCFL